MKNNYLIGLLLIMTAVLGSGFEAFATEEVGEVNTDAGIKITEPALWLTEVSDVGFEQHIASKNSLTLEAKNDLQIKIKDNRQNGTPWSLSISFPPFTDQTGQQVTAPEIKLGKGTFENDTSSGQAANLIANTDKVIAKQRQISETPLQVYTIPKTKVILELPENFPAGKYSTTLNYVLKDAP